MFGIGRSKGSGGGELSFRRQDFTTTMGFVETFLRERSRDPSNDIIGVSSDSRGVSFMHRSVGLIAVNEKEGIVYFTSFIRCRGTLRVPLDVVKSSWAHEGDPQWRVSPGNDGGNDYFGVYMRTWSSDLETGMDLRIALSDYVMGFIQLSTNMSASGAYVKGPTES